MKFCQPHWDALRAALDARGLSHLIAKDGTEAAARMKRDMQRHGATVADSGPGVVDAKISLSQAKDDPVTDVIDGRSAADDFDPLMSANWAITAQALRAGGLYLMGADEHGHEYCPLCEVKAHANAPDADKNWIEGCSDEMLDHARDLGLVTTH